MYSKKFKLKGNVYRINYLRVYTALAVMFFCLTLLSFMGEKVSANEVVVDKDVTIVVTESAITTSANTTYNNIITPETDIYTKDITTTPSIVVESDIESVRLYTDEELKERYLANFKKLNGREFKSEWYDYLVKQCEANDLPVELMLSIVSCESGGDPKCRNKSSGALGLFQIMEGTFYDTRRYLKDKKIRFRDMRDPYKNIRYGCTIMRMKIDWRGSLKKGLYSYGGCKRASTKRRYLRWVNKHMSKITNLTVAEVIVVANKNKIG